MKNGAWRGGAWSVGGRYDANEVMCLKVLEGNT